MYEVYDGWTVVLVVCELSVRFGWITYFQFPIEPRFQGECDATDHS